MDEMTKEVISIFKQMNRHKQNLMLALVSILTDSPTSPEEQFIMKADLSDPKQFSEIVSILEHHVTQEVVN